MNPESKQQWFALYTRSKWEKKVSETLAKKKLEVYCPVTKAPRQWYDRKKVATEPLFSSYVFVYASPAEQAKIKDIDGVVNFVHWLNQPAVIRQEEIDMIKRFLNEYDHVTLERTSVNLNDRVRIINGPLMMWEGNVVEIKTNTIKLALPSLGYTLVAEIRRENIEPVVSLQEAKMKAV